MPARKYRGQAGTIEKKKQAKKAISLQAAAVTFTMRAWNHPHPASVQDPRQRRAMWVEWHAKSHTDSPTPDVLTSSITWPAVSLKI